MSEMIRICHSVLNHPAPFGIAALGGTVACVLHCCSVCVLCATGGAGLATAFARACKLLLPRLVPVFVSVTGFLSLSA